MAQFQTLSVPSPAAPRRGMISMDIEGQYWKYFAFIVGVGFLMRLACFTGLIGSDDVVYSHFAQLMSQLSYRPELHHAALRYGLLLPLGVLYRVFGVGEWTTIMVPLMASTLSVPAVMLIGQKLLGSRVALLAGMLIATFPAELRYATILVPEPLAEFYGLVAILIYLYWELRIRPQRGFYPVCAWEWPTSRRNLCSSLRPP